jgi:hypothetical protein
MATLKEDIQTFFSLPIPKMVWKETQRGTDPKFISFVEACPQITGGVIKELFFDLVKSFP